MPTRPAIVCRTGELTLPRRAGVHFAEPVDPAKRTRALRGRPAAQGRGVRRTRRTPVGVGRSAGAVRRRAPRRRRRPCGGWLGSAGCGVDFAGVGSVRRAAASTLRGLARFEGLRRRLRGVGSVWRAAASTSQGLVFLADGRTSARSPRVCEVGLGSAPARPRGSGARFGGAAASTSQGLVCPRKWSNLCEVASGSVRSAWAAGLGSRLGPGSAPARPGPARLGPGPARLGSARLGPGSAPAPRRSAAGAHRWCRRGEHAGCAAEQLGIAAAARRLVDLAEVSAGVEVGPARHRVEGVGRGGPAQRPPGRYLGVPCPTSRD